MRSFAAVLGKELLVRWRARAGILAVLVFGAVSLLLFSFAVGPSPLALGTYASGFLWLALLLASTLSLAESFQCEIENDALEGMLLLGINPAAVYYAKALANGLEICLLGAVLLPEMIILYDASVQQPLRLAGALLLGSAALAAPGTLYAAMTAQAGSRSTLLPLLLFPLVVPVLIAAVKSTGLALGGDPLHEWSAWAGVLIGFNAVHWPLGGLLFDRVAED